ncbi:hypothetical protein T265_05301 [Opisthorchis viverrini]|uniref:LicD/FKTN/FKRP nucleotidyltransferase domain-containing protein n=1 Tax=Opisthorchis viverrini TaxID=6198 RepID=A0A074ZPF5_OPIVI|nr:hypothetical protein T265_05301 [Opisthorchis viverrini]KER27667.1 hypothetical protein T265_05301 [Opisthorchis viverrini]
MSIVNHDHLVSAIALLLLLSSYFENVIFLKINMYTLVYSNHIFCSAPCSPTQKPMRMRPARCIHALPVTILVSLLLVFWWAWKYDLTVVYLNGLSNSNTPETLMVDPYLVKPYWANTSFRSLPDLEQLNWPATEYSPVPVARIDKLTGSMEPHPRAFQPVFSRGQRALVSRLLALFAQVLSTNGLGDRFIINAGSLHGSLRHHDIIPYDDDVDVCMELSVLPRVIELFRAHEPDYVLYTEKRRGKLYTRQIPPELEQTDAEYSRNTSKYPWFWPAVDICYYTNNKTHVYEVGANTWRRTWLISEFYPLLFRPFGHRWYPTPFNPIQYIRTMVTQDRFCFRPGYSHVFETSLKLQATPCQNLGMRFAFVERSRVNNRSITFPPRASDHLKQLVICEERLIIQSRMNQAPTVFHTLQLPVHPDLAMLDTYDYGKNKEG